MRIHVVMNDLDNSIIGRDLMEVEPTCLHNGRDEAVSAMANALFYFQRGNHDGKQEGNLPQDP